MPVAQLPCCSAYPSRQFRQHCYWPPCSGEDSPFSISVGAQRLMLTLVTGSNKKTSLPSATFRFPSRKPASITNSRRKLKLTPMQYTLMEMFYLSSSHLLFKSDICQIAMAGKRQCRRNALHIDTASEAHCRGQQQPQNNNRSWPRLRTGNKNLNIIRIMKTNKLILLGLICLTVAMPTTAQNRKRKESSALERASKRSYCC